MTRPRFIGMSRLVSAFLLITGALVATGSTATAAPISTSDARAAGITVVQPSGTSTDEFGVLSYPANCFGYVGTFKDNSTVVLIPWVTASDECFGIAPNRTIWHTWPGAGGWHQMPGNGRADDTRGGTEYPATGNRVVSVWVNGSGPYCQNYLRGSGGWTGSWYAC